MLRRLALIALFLFPSSLEAQGPSAFYPNGYDIASRPDGRPIATWCMSTLQTQCISIFNWSFGYENSPEGWSEASFTADASITPVAEFFETYVSVLTIDGWQFPLDSDLFARASSQTGYFIGSTGGASEILRATTPNDPMWFSWDAQSCVTRRTPQYRDANICVSVPEPGSLLLLATGLVGIGGVGWRRRRAA